MTPREEDLIYSAAFVIMLSRDGSRADVQQLSAIGTARESAIAGVSAQQLWELRDLCEQAAKEMSQRQAGRAT